MGADVSGSRKRALLLRNGLGNAVWVETGTYVGDTTDALSKYAKAVYSIEPEPTLFANAKDRFLDAPNVTILNGISEEVLPDLLTKLSGDVCFWLDGHYSEGITYKGPQDTPIVDELAAIEKNIDKMGRVVVFVDDVCLFENPLMLSYPPVEFLMEWAVNNDMEWRIEDDIFIARRGC